MGYWGWRPLPLLLCICVLIVACSDDAGAPPTDAPADSQSVTLIVRTPLPETDRDPALMTVVTVPAVLPTNMPAGGPSLAAKSPTPLALTTQPPTCYEAFSGGVLCLGTITNSLAEPVIRPVVTVVLYDRSGQVLRQTTVAADRRYLPPGESAPYQAVFNAEDRLYLAEDFGAAQSMLVRADAIVGSSRFASLDTRISGETRDDRLLTLDVTLSNDDAHAYEAIWVGVIVFDELERVAGFRVVEGGPLPIGEDKRLEISLVPQAVPGDLHYAIYAEGLIARGGGG